MYRIQRGSVFITPNGIYASIDGVLIQINMLCADERGVFVHYLIQSHDFAYTIFGSKPMSLADISLELPHGLSLQKQLKARFILMKTKRWLNAWYNNKNKFGLRDFIFLDKEEDLAKCLILVLINKKNLLDVLRDHELKKI